MDCGVNHEPWYAVPDALPILSSPWFQFFYLNQSTNVQPFNMTPGYLGNWLGLQTLDVAGRVQLRQTNCPHQDLPRDVCKKWYDLYTQPLLNNTLP